jgi:hypothetical protein
MQNASDLPEPFVEGLSVYELKADWVYAFLCGGTQREELRFIDVAWNDFNINNALFIANNRLLADVSCYESQVFFVGP